MQEKRQGRSKEEGKKEARKKARTRQGRKRE